MWGTIWTDAEERRDNAIRIVVAVFVILSGPLAYLLHVLSH
jgi:hypothetical protein